MKIASMIIHTKSDMPEPLFPSKSSLLLFDGKEDTDFADI